MTALKSDQIVVGLDIGSTKVCAVAGRLIRNKDFPTLEVLGVGRVDSGGVTRGSVVNINKTVSAINQAIEEAGNQADIDIGLVNVSFSSNTISARRQIGTITRNSPGDEVTSSDIEQLLKDMYKTVIPPGNEIVHVLPMDFTVDNEPGIEDPVGRNGVKLGADFQIVMAPANAALNTKKCIERAANNSLKRDQLVLSVLASGMAVLTEDEKQAGVALVDIGGGTTDIAIYHKNVLRYISILPWAGNSLTNDIEQGCKVLSNHAEQIKVRFGNANPADSRLNEVVSVPGLVNRQPKDVLLRNVSLIMEDRLKEIAALVQAEILRSGFEHKLLAGIVLTGGTASTPNIEAIFKRVTGMDVRVGYPEWLEHNGRADLVSDPAYATALGLVWAGFKQVDERIPSISLQGSVDYSGGGRTPTASPPYRPPMNPPQPPSEEKPAKGWFQKMKDFFSGDNFIEQKDSY